MYLSHTKTHHAMEMFDVVLIRETETGMMLILFQLVMRCLCCCPLPRSQSYPCLPSLFWKQAALGEDNNGSNSAIRGMEDIAMAYPIGTGLAQDEARGAMGGTGHLSDTWRDDSSFPLQPQWSEHDPLER